jgi:dTDP-4-amino-4,6-dideoxygalactose transaminase
MNRRTFLAASAVPLSPAAAAPPTTKNLDHTWPVFDEEEERALLAVLREGHWNRGSVVEQFESQYAKLLGADGCLATANGTSALLTTLHALGVKPGDEVIVPPYTFIATINVVLQMGAIPVFVDSDRETFQIDARKIEAAITPRTVAIMPVHLGGGAADMDAILAIGKKRNLPVIEDACQAHLAEWRGRKVGTLGQAGCFSFQASKNLNSGEGGAIVSSDPELIERSFEFHNNGRRRKGGGAFTYTNQGLNLRITEFQAAILLSQMTRLEKQAQRREENAKYLSSMLKEIPGITPAKEYDGCTRNAYHLYMFRYAGKSRDAFLKALAADGVPASSGYSPLNKQPFIQTALSRYYPKKEVEAWGKRNQCPENDRLCSEAVWFTQTVLLGTRSDMDQIAAAVRKASS